MAKWSELHFSRRDGFGKDYTGAFDKHLRFSACLVLRMVEVASEESVFLDFDFVYQSPFRTQLAWKCESSVVFCKQ